MRASLHVRLIASLKSWWAKFRQRLRWYEQRNLAEWQYWGTRRAERELGNCPDLGEADDCCERCDRRDCRDRRPPRSHPARLAHSVHSARSAPPLERMDVKAIW